MHGVRGLRELVEPRMQLLKRLAIAAFALFNPRQEPPQQDFDRLLIPGGTRKRRIALACVFGAAGLPTCFRGHPIPVPKRRPFRATRPLVVGLVRGRLATERV